MKKLLIFVQPTLGISGSELSLLEILKGVSVQTRDYDLSVLAGEHGKLQKEFEKHVNVLIRPFKKIRKNWSSFSEFIRSSFSLYGAFIEQKERYDEVQVYVNTLMIPQAVIASWIAGCRCVVHVREVSTTYPYIIYCAYYAIAAIFSTRLVAVCDFVKRQKIVRVVNRVFRKDVAVIYNSASFQFGNKENVPDDFTIISVMPFTRKKGAIDLIDFVIALRKSRPHKIFKLIVVGKIEDAQLFKKEERKLEEQGCSAHIKFVGELKIDRLAEYYERAWIMVHPSHTEAFPRVLVEAMNFGLPCIATRVGGVSEIIEDRVNGFTVEVGDVVQMARCAVELLENSQLRHELSKNALATYTERFSNKVMAEKVMNVIESNW